MSRSAAIAALVALGACFFELADPVTSATGGGGAGGDDPTGGAPADWWDVGYSRRSILTLNDVPALSDVPVAVVLDSQRVDYQAAADAGRDLRFVAADGSLLPYEIERWDPTGRSLVWLRLSDVSTGVAIGMYYGHPAATAGEQPQSVWTDYAAVYHFADPPDAGSVVRDSAGTHDGLADNFVPSALSEGTLGPAYVFDGSRYVTVSFDDGLDISGAGSLEVVIRLDGLADNSTVAQKEGCCLGWLLDVQGDGALRQSWGKTNCCSGTPSYDYVFWDPPVSLVDGWHHIVAVWDVDAGIGTLFVDGAQVEQSGLSPASAINGTFRIGADYIGGNGLIGTLEELRLSLTAYDAIRAEVHDLVRRDALISYGAIESLP